MANWKLNTVEINFKKSSDNNSNKYQNRQTKPKYFQLRDRELKENYIERLRISRWEEKNHLILKIKS